MNKLIKICIIGGIALTSLNVAFHHGKGYMLGMVCAYEGVATPSDILDAISSDKRFRMNYIHSTAKQTKTRIKRNDGL